MHIGRNQMHNHDYHNYKAHDKAQATLWKEPAHKSDHYDYNPADFIQRLLATLLDGAILFPWLYLANHFDNIWVAIIAAWIYYGVFDSSRFQATPGKRALKIYVTDFRERRLTPFEAFFRRAVTILFAFIFPPGLLLSIFSQHRQALHDMMTGTLVRRGKPGEEEDK